MPLRTNCSPKIAFLRLHKRIESLDLTATHRVRHASKHRERLGQFIAGECFGCFSDFDRLRHSDPKVFRLFDQPSRLRPFGFGRIDQIEAKNVFLIAGANVKTIPVICRIENELAIFRERANPWFRRVLQDRQSPSKE